MTLYFDVVVENSYRGVINTHLAWHSEASVLAVASHSDEKGGIISVFTGEGKPCEDVDIPPHKSARVTSISWHPVKRILAIGWETGELYIYNDHEKELHEIQSLHKSAVSIVQFSHSGKRVVTADTSGSLVGWNADANGNIRSSFSHDLSDTLSQIVFRTKSHELDISSLARAAIMGDERALDIFSSWRPKTGHKRTALITSDADNLNFFLGSNTGVVYHVTESGACNQVLQADGGVKSLLHHASKNILVVITEGLVLGQFSVESDGGLREIHKVKLSGRSSDILVTWAGTGLLAVSTGDNFLRIWNLETGYNFVLDLKESCGYKMNENVLTISFSDAKMTLAAGTNMGNIAMWKRLDDDKSIDYVSEPEKLWKLQPPSTLGGAVTQICWGSAINLLAANTVNDVFIFHEKDLAVSYFEHTTVVQTSPTKLSIDVFDSNLHMDHTTDFQIRGISNTSDHFIVWSGRRLFVYEINAVAEKVRVLDSFTCESENALLYESNIYSIENSLVRVRSFQGAIKQTLTFHEQDGEPVGLHLNGNFLVVATLLGTVKIWDLSKKEAKATHKPIYVQEFVQDFGEIISARCNCTATQLSIAVAQTTLLPDPKLYILDLENENRTYFNFSTGQCEAEDELNIDDTDTNFNDRRKLNDVTHQDRLQYETSKEVEGRFVINHFWDAEEPRLLVCEAKANDSHKNKRRNRKNKTSLLGISLFVTRDHGIVVQETFVISPIFLRLIASHVPFLYLLNFVGSAEAQASGLVTRKTFRDFVGLEDADRMTRNAMVDFSFFLTLGQMDDAFNAIKGIKSKTVWENMAKMCVKTKRLDVAFLCLGNMGHARGARALRQAMGEPELDARVAMLALQLNMMEEAEELYKNCGRYDLLNSLYQSAGMWSKAIDVAEREDRIHLRSTHYNFAKQLEDKGDLAGAIDHYEKSDTYRFEVPRMLFDELPTLEDYIMHTDDKSLRRWWAQYLESTGEMETALQFYDAANDHLSLVRVYCYCNDMEKAAEIANSSGDKAASYHLARQYENVDKVKEAIHFFSRAHAYANAIRLCKENAFDDQLFNLALVAGRDEQIDAARYFMNCDRPQISRAVMLYHKAGLLAKAVDLAFESGQVSTVAQIAAELDETADPEVINKCSEYFISIGQFDKAVNLLIIGKQFMKALDMAVENNVRITEDLAEKFTLPEEDPARVQVLEKVAECAYAQQDYKLATKKFTQAGNKIKAMKCLLKSGDTDRIIYFANVCRNQDIYILAANYLQTLELHKKPNLVRTIVQFYTKAKALTLLAAFYESCAQIEVDEYQDYEKALVALKEALKCLSNASANEARSKSEEVAYKAERIQRFIELKNCLKSETGDHVVRELYEMTGESNIEKAVRGGDIYSVLVEYYVEKGNYKTALLTLNDMKSKMPNVNPNYFVATEILKRISKETGVAIETRNNFDENDEENDSGDEIEEIEDETRGRGKQIPAFLDGAAKFL